MDLGVKPEKPTEAVGPSLGTSEGPKIMYPSFSIPEKLMDDFLEAHPVEFEDEVTARVKLRVTGMRQEDYGSGITLSVLSIDNIKPISSESSDKKDYPNPAVRRMMGEEDNEE
jgi:hypothetical protein